MKLLRDLPERLVNSFKSIIKPPAQEPATAEKPENKGNAFLKLHEYQHRVIVEIFKISIAGFAAFTLILIGFAFYTLIDPVSPYWMTLIVAVLGGLLVLALYRTYVEFRTYRKTYSEMSTRLRAKLDQSHGKTKSSLVNAGKTLENHLLAALKPKEHTGWDNKNCGHCQKIIEMQSKVCQHCGQEQNSIQVN